jgi:hypothetical protein
MSVQRVCVPVIIALLLLPATVAAQQREELVRGGADWPTEPRALRLLERQLEIGELGPLPPIFVPAEPRYLVTYMNSQTADRIRSATAVTVTNQSPSHCLVGVSYFKGFSPNSSPVCSTSFIIPPEFTVDFCSRNLPLALTVCNSTCSPELTFDEGRAIVSSTCREIGVSGRVYYTSGDDDGEVAAISDSKIVAFGRGNTGD